MVPVGKTVKVIQMLMPGVPLIEQDAETGKRHHMYKHIPLRFPRGRQNRRVPPLAVLSKHSVPWDALR